MPDSAALGIAERQRAGRTRQSMEPVLARLEAQRLAAIRSFCVTTVRCVAALPLVGLPFAGFAFLTLEHAPGSLADRAADWLRGGISPFGLYVVLGAVVWLAVGLYLISRHFVRGARRPVWDYVRAFKAEVLNHVCATHFPGLRYEPSGYVGYDEFDATRLFAHASDEYRSEDYFAGRAGRTDVCFAEVVAKRERRRFREGRFETYLDEFFRGIVFIADFHKHFHSTTRLIPRGAKAAKVDGQEPVTFEDPEFEEAFHTSSTDQVDVRYILSTSMLARFTDLNRRFPRMRALFRDEKLTLALPSRGDKFEPSILRRADSSVQIDEFVRDIRSLLRIVEELDLDTRIWSKA